MLLLLTEARFIKDRQQVKRLSAVRETWVRSLSREDPLEKEMATHSTILAWRFPWTEETMRLQRVEHNLETKQQQQYIRVK